MLDPSGSLVDQALFRDICACAVPTPLLKFGRGGKFSKPGFRNFFVSADLSALCWKSKMRGEKKIEGDKKVLFLDVTRIHFGQRTEKFKKNNRLDLENLSFSLVFYDKGKEDTLDLVCKDEVEFQTWNSVLGALHEDKLSPPELEIMKQKLKTHLDEVEKNKVKKGDAKDDDDDVHPNDVYGFGWGEWGQNGTGEHTSVSKPVLLSNLLGKGILAAACGWSHTTVLLENGEIQAYGNSVGTAFGAETFVPAPVPMTRVRVVAVACGGFHSAALTAEGHCLTWGSNAHGQLGHGHIRDVKSPTIVEDLLQTSMGLENNITMIACSMSSTICTAENGSVYTWGSGEHGVLGQGNEDDSWSPKQIKELIGVDVEFVAAGDSHLFAATGEGETYAWGWNACSQLGLGHEEDQYKPHIVEGLRGKNVISLSAGAIHSIAVVTELSPGGVGDISVVYSWGSNMQGQIGQGKTVKICKTPTVVTGIPQMTAVSCGSMHSCLLSDQSDLWVAGYNNFGQLGCENPAGGLDYKDVFQPCQWFKESGKKVRTISCGGQHTAVLSGRMWIDDKETKECMNCKVVFTFTNRKHHCRNCMGIFCGPCSNKKFAILKFGSSKMVRVCINCYTKLAGR
jgi:alpha-tubulin suppressor-like RCC1 family protein